MAAEIFDAVRAFGFHVVARIGLTRWSSVVLSDAVFGKIAMISRVVPVRVIYYIELGSVVIGSEHDAWPGMGM